MAHRSVFFTSSNDDHCVIVSRAIECNGGSASIVETDRIGHDILMSACYDSETEACLQVSNKEGKALSEFSRHEANFWIRRVAPPKIADFDPDDNEVTSRNFRELLLGWLGILSAQMPTCSPVWSLIAAENKVWQLSEAARVGLPIPKTIIGNSYPRLIDVLGESAPVIFKGIRRSEWAASQNSRASALPSVLVGDGAHTLDGIDLFPAIVQSYSEKRSDIRAVFFGAEHQALEFIPHNSYNGRIDILEHNMHDFDILPVKLDEALQGRCVSLLKRLGLSMGAFDFVVDNARELKFLEVNAGGNFLRMEALSPALSVVELAAQFFESGAPGDPWNFRYDKRSNVRTLRELTLSYASSVMNPAFSATTRDDFVRMIASGDNFICVFSKPGCQPCETVKACLSQVLMQSSGDLKVVVLVCETEAIRDEFNIRFFPTLAFYKNGNISSSIRGALQGEADNRRRIEQWITRIKTDMIRQEYRGS